MGMANSKYKALVSRISISLPEDLLIDLDGMVGDRGFESRSQAIGDMINRQLIEHKRQTGNEVMAGTVTLLYDRSTRGLQKQLSDLQHLHIDEVISSLHVQLMHNQTMEVILVQGPAQKLRDISDQMITLRGVISGRMQLMAAVMPPLHSPASR
jgi:CopG family nickel-responsive transcriptional regulator